VQSFQTIIQKFADKGHQTGWTYIDIPQDIILNFNRKDKKDFRVKGYIDNVTIERMTIFPTGKGNYILALNAQLRKLLGKKEGAIISLKIEVDTNDALKSQDLLDCLNEDAVALKQFNSLAKSHQNYFHNYINSAKGFDTRAGRIINTLLAMNKKMSYSEMIRSLKK
jgi:hypothetical protein